MPIPIPITAVTPDDIKFRGAKIILSIDDTPAITNAVLEVNGGFVQIPVTNIREQVENIDLTNVLNETVANLALRIKNLGITLLVDKINEALQRINQAQSRVRL